VVVKVMLWWWRWRCGGGGGDMGWRYGSKGHAAVVEMMMWCLWWCC
jgi:hypothetical protein